MRNALVWTHYYCLYRIPEARFARISSFSISKKGVTQGGIPGPHVYYIDFPLDRVIVKFPGERLGEGVEGRKRRVGGEGYEGEEDCVEESRRGGRGQG